MRRTDRPAASIPCAPFFDAAARIPIVCSPFRPISAKRGPNFFVASRTGLTMSGPATVAARAMTSNPSFASFTMPSRSRVPTVFVASETEVPIVSEK